MKKVLTTCCCVGLGVMVHGNAIAVLSMCLEQICASDTEIVNTIPNNCKTYSEKCYNGYRVYVCTECYSGYTLTAGTPVTISGCANTVDPKSCTADCVETDCDDETWTDFTTGYQVYKTRTWNASTCSCTTMQSYRCDDGYYGTASCVRNVVTGGYACTGCSKCPSGGVYTDAALTTPATAGCFAGNGKTVESCYLPIGTYYDASGKFTLSGPANACTYSN